MSVILALDLGTTGNRAIAFNKKGQALFSSYYEFKQHFPKPSWVEHDPIDIWRTTVQTIQDVITELGSQKIAAIGITNQRETTVVWNKKTGKPVYNAIVWQCRRTAQRCKELQCIASSVRKKTGLFLDPYFSASKLEWILNHVSNLDGDLDKGNILFGTIDSWILWNLTQGKIHATDPSNASRTMLYNIHRHTYDSDLLQHFSIPRHILPQVLPSSSFFGLTDKRLFNTEIPIHGLIGDQQAALFSQCGADYRRIKNTYGTGLFLMAATGTTCAPSTELIQTVAWQLGENAIEYALEGSIFVGGSAIQWLRDELKLIHSASDTAQLADSISDTNGVYFVPALTGLGAPYWDPDARGLFIGLTRGSNRTHLVRAVLESLAYQTQDIINLMTEYSPQIKALRVDGGASKNSFLMHYQASVSQLVIEKPTLSETTALGAAGIAGISSGFWTATEFHHCLELEKIYTPKPDAIMSAQKNYAIWKQAVSRSLKWNSY